MKKVKVFSFPLNGPKASSLDVTDTINGFLLRHNAELLDIKHDLIKNQLWTTIVYEEKDNYEPIGKLLD